jgi:signal-transduction protein with cAMP-binding, CBS, and nucleotidyltransferase domain
MKIVYYKANDIIFRKGSPIYKLIVIFEGRLKKFRSPNVLASAGEVWG